MLVRLTRKHAECLDGVDLSGHRVGQIISLPDRDAALLIAEGWAVPTVTEFGRVAGHAGTTITAPAAHKNPLTNPQQPSSRR
jgi:hypothetical protein